MDWRAGKESHMSFDIQIKCRLDDLMDEKDITPEELAMASGVSEMKIKQYQNGALESASIYFG